MSKKSMKRTIASVLCILMLFTACSNKTTHDEPKENLVINGWVSSLGGLNQTNLDITVFSYTMYLKNNNDHTVYINHAQPSINPNIDDKIISDDIMIPVNKELKPDETIQISGEILVDTKGLSKSEITELEPFMTDMTINLDETVDLT